LIYTFNRDYLFEGIGIYAISKANQEAIEMEDHIEMHNLEEELSLSSKVDIK
jgi:hypothetical protein